VRCREREPITTQNRQNPERPLFSSPNSTLVAPLPNPGPSPPTGPRPKVPIPRFPWTRLQVSLNLAKFKTVTKFVVYKSHDRYRLNKSIFWFLLGHEQLQSVCVGQKGDEVGHLGPVLTEDQSAALSASVRVRYGRLTEMSKCAHRDVCPAHAPSPSPSCLVRLSRFEGVGDAVEALGKL